MDHSAEPTRRQSVLLTQLLELAADVGMGSYWRWHGCAVRTRPSDLAHG